MLFSFARISAVPSLKRQDFYYQGPRRWLRFHEKGGKEHEMPAHHEIEETIDEYLARVIWWSGATHAQPSAGSEEEFQE
jgi:hypothetical protein